MNQPLRGFHGQRTTDRLYVKLNCFADDPVRAARGAEPRGIIVAINQDLLEILACPACKAKVDLKPDESGLKCRECKRVYPIRDDIPVMLIDEATVEDEEPAS